MDDSCTSGIVPGTLHNIYSSIMSVLFRGRNSIDAVIGLVMSVEQQKDQRRITGAVSLHIKGAFDNVAHDAIMNSLEDLGIDGASTAGSSATSQAYPSSYTDTGWGHTIF